MARAQRIDDHASWMGKSSKESPLPMESKMKFESSAEGAGSEMDYEDTTEEIRKQQVDGTRKVKSHPMKPNYRN